MQLAQKPPVRGYEVQELIGKGGFGEVYHAYQSLGDITRDVAVKVILPQHANQPDFVRRFEREAQIIARLEHPYIVPMYDYWREPDGAFLVMRWLPQSLREYLKASPLDLPGILRLVDHLAAALRFAHRYGVIHRDVKPSNILLDEEGNYYLTDFGIAKDLISTLGQTEANLLVGDPRYLSPEQARGDIVAPQTDIYCFGVVLYEVLTGEHPFVGTSSSGMIAKHLTEPLPSLSEKRPDLPDAVDEILQKATHKDITQRYDNTMAFASAFRDAIQRATDSVVVQTHGSDDDTLATWTPAERHPIVRNPYKGLRPFEEADANDFFGRDALIDQLLARLNEDHPFRRFLAVVGPSGSGKSSVVKAGLIPAIRDGQLAGSDEWYIAEMLPGEYPLQELTNALNSIATRSVSHVAEQLTTSERGLVWAVDSILPDDAHVFLVVDQFEELFTGVTDVAAIEQFLDVLRVAIADPNGCVTVIITLRADFMDRPLQYLEFGDMLKQRIEYVLPMSAQELSLAITRPAELAGTKVEQALLSAIIADVQDEPGALPLLQYTLHQLADRSPASTLTLQDYRAMGGVLGALAQRAEAIFHELDAVHRPAAQQIFLRLVTLGEGTEDTRRRVKRSELASVVPIYAQLESILHTFGKARLLTFDHDPQTREPTVEVAHEALLREWQRLRDWLDDSRHDIRQERALATAATEWIQSEQDESYLLRDARLNQFIAWARTSRITLTELEQNFLDASVAEQAKREARQRQIRNGVVVIAVLIAIVTSGLALLALNREQEAQDARATSQSNLVLAEREAAVNRSLVLSKEAEEARGVGFSTRALLLAMEAVSIDDPPADTIRTLQNIARSVGERAILTGHQNAVQTVALSSTGQLALSGSCAELTPEDICVRGELILWDVGGDATSVAEIGRLEGHTDWVKSVAIAPDGLTAISSSQDGTLILWDIDQESASFGEVIYDFDANAGSANSVAILRDGTGAVCGYEDGSITLWDLTTGQRIRDYEGHEGPVNSVALSFDGTQMVSGSQDASILVWNIDTAEQIQIFEGHTSGVGVVFFTPDGSAVLSRGNDLTVRSWDVETGEGTILHRAVVNSRCLAITPDGRSVFVCDAVVLTTWNYPRWYQTDYNIFEYSNLGGPGDWLTSLAVSSDGYRLLVGTETNKISLVNLEVPSEEQRFAEEGTSIASLAVSPDGRYLVTGTYGTDTIVWDIETGQIIRRLEDDGLVTNDVIFSPDGRYVVTSQDDFSGGTQTHYQVVWDMETGEPVTRFGEHDYFTNGQAFGNDGHTILSGSFAFSPAWETTGLGDLILWDATTGELIHRFDYEGTVNHVTLNRSMTLGLAVSAPYQEVTLWDVDTASPTFGQLIKTLKMPNGGFDVKFSADESAFFVATTAGTLQMWDIATGALLKTFTGHDGWVVSLDISPDGQYLLSGGSDGYVILWDIATGEELRRYAGHAAGIWNVAFSPDGRTAFSSSYDGTVIQWQIADWTLEETLTWISKNRYIRDFSCEERQQYRIQPLCK